MTSTLMLHALCAALYLGMSGLILIQSRRSRTGVFLAGACLATAAWGAAVAVFWSQPLDGIAGSFDLLRSGAWYLFILHLYRRSVPSHRQLIQAFVMMGFIGALMIGVTLLIGGIPQADAAGFWSVGTTIRLGFAVCNLLLIENLYLNTNEDTKWHVVLPSIALGALSVYDIVLSADAVLFHQVSVALFDGRAVATAIVAPLLALSAARNRNWAVDIHISRTAAFHSATLIGAGLFLLCIAAAGEALRVLGSSWGGVAEISLIFAGVITLVVLLTSSTARSHLRSLLVDHFFSHRFDYRREWMRSINTLAAVDAYTALHTRVIRSIAEVVDSPGGVLFLREDTPHAQDGGGDRPFRWAGSWRLPAVPEPIPPDHPLISAMRGGTWIVELGRDGGASGGELPGLANAWLAVPLNHGGQAIGFIVVAPPRAGFRLDREVYDLLRILGRQVATYVAERRAAEILMQARQLLDYSKRFAFVAHDIKNVSTQLSLLLSNAEIHMSNPEFQKDMLTTVRASVQKIGALLKRLEAPSSEVRRNVIIPTEQLEPLVAAIGRARGLAIPLDQSGQLGGVAMPREAFDAVVTHLLTNAIEATDETGGADKVRVSTRQDGRRLQIDIIDRGPGMSADFVRDSLFRPFDTSKPGGSGIGAFQARELLREAGGDLAVITEPGAGTTMRILLPLVDGPAEREKSPPASHNSQAAHGRLNYSAD